MATIGTQAGISFVVKYATLNGTPAVIGGANSGSLTINNAEIDITDKDGSGWKENLVGIKSWSVSSGGFMQDKNTSGTLDTLEDLVVAGTKAEVEIVDQSGKKYTGQGVITSWETSGTVGEAQTYSITVSGDGALGKTDQS